MKYNLADFIRLKKNLKPNSETMILSGSMTPWIKTNEVINLSPCLREDLKPFDIIVFWSPESEILICHIYIEFRDGKIITKSLTRNVEDPPLDPQFLLGRVNRPRFTWLHKMILKFFY